MDRLIEFEHPLFEKLLGMVEHTRESKNYVQNALHLRVVGGYLEVESLCLNEDMERWYNNDSTIVPLDKALMMLIQ